MQPILTGKGYWLVAGDGGSSPSADATFSGSVGGHSLISRPLGVQGFGDGLKGWRRDETDRLSPQKVWLASTLQRKISSFSGREERQMAYSEWVRAKWAKKAKLYLREGEQVQATVPAQSKKPSPLAYPSRNLTMDHYVVVVTDQRLLLIRVGGWGGLREVEAELPRETRLSPGHGAPRGRMEAFGRPLYVRSSFRKQITIADEAVAAPSGIAKA